MGVRETKVGSSQPDADHRLAGKSGATGKKRWCSERPNGTNLLTSSPRFSSLDRAKNVASNRRVHLTGNFRIRIIVLTGREQRPPCSCSVITLLPLREVLDMKRKVQDEEPLRMSLHMEGKIPLPSLPRLHWWADGVLTFFFPMPPITGTALDKRTSWAC